MGVVRLFLGALLALVVTFGLFITMYSLIKVEEVSLDDGKRAKLAEVVMETKEIEAIRKEVLPEKPEDPEEPPPEFEQPEMEDLALDVNAGPVVAPAKADVKIGMGPSMAVSDGEYLPIVKVAPVYPRRAQSRGIQGYCTVAYSVTKTGSTRDPQAVDCKPKGMFERASVAAALKFKYKPKIVNGEPIEVPGVKNRFTFQLQD